MLRTDLNYRVVDKNKTPAYESVSYALFVHLLMFACFNQALISKTLVWFLMISSFELFKV